MAFAQAASLAPLAIAFVGFCALCAALWSIGAQKRLARRRAAIDFFLKTEMDDKMLQAWDNYLIAVKELKNVSSMKEFELTEKYRHIRAYLNIHELLAVGIRNKVFDRRVCYDFWGDVLLNACNESQKVIEYVQCIPNGKATYADLLKLRQRWIRPKRLFPVWRRE
jgi:Domain of unknown function (DUF4760)